METYDFEYDGITLSDMGYSLCQFDSDGLQTVSNGSAISFRTTSTLNGAKHELTSTAYEECLTATLQICKNPFIHEDLYISMDESRELMRWLNRKGFHKFKLLDDEHIDLFFEASFNVRRIEISGRLCGLELEMITNRPFAQQEKRLFTIHNDRKDGRYMIYDTSDEEGHIYPHVEITVLNDGVLEIHNALEDRRTRIGNCRKNEVITMDYPIIKTSVSSHKIENDFNWEFLRIANTLKNKQNNLTISIPCDIRIAYSPIVKAGI